MKKIIYILFITLISQSAFAQQKISGTIYENTAEENMPLPGVNVYWADTQIGTVTDFDGKFEIPFEKNNKGLIVSFVGYKTDTIQVKEPARIEHWMVPDSQLDAIVLKSRKQTAFKSYLSSQNVINISSAELLKAACCNLAESFETNPAIDVHFPDAITGNKKIQMLGLTSPNTLISIENIPAIRGAAHAFGLSFYPGTWVESIQISKGAGSVVQGYESIAGQINVELQKPTTDHPFFLNAYASADGRLELNNHSNFKLNPKWHTGLYLHGNFRESKMDNNNDGFLDNPLAKQLNILNRWQYTDEEKGWVGFLTMRMLTDQKQTGQVDFNPDSDKFQNNFWGGEIETLRADASLKIGYVFPDIPYQSFGIQSAFSYHKQDSYFGFNVYDIEHQSFYANGIFSSIIGDTRHNFQTGLSFTHDRYDELVNIENYGREEFSTGVFFEYAYDNLDNLLITAGIRADYHNKIKGFITPRLHVRYTPWEQSAIKFSVGRGVRLPSIFVENQQLFASSREILILNANGELYGLDAEKAWNYGLSFMQGFNLWNKNAEISIDFYRTDFQNQIVVDWEDPRQVRFYNLDGKSFANTFQSEFSYDPADFLSLRLSYRYLDAQTDYLEGRKEKALTPKHRFFANAGFQSPITNKNRQWKFDATYNFLSKQRFPSTEANPEPYRRSEFSPEINTVNAQLTRVFSSKFEVYVGGENITNVRQNNPIISAENPFGEYFDSTLVYGPVFGSMYYAGLRLKL